MIAVIRRVVVMWVLAGALSAGRAQPPSDLPEAGTGSEDPARDPAGPSADPETGVPPSGPATAPASVAPPADPAPTGPVLSSPPPYPVLGSQPESMVQEGDWNPWDHAEPQIGHDHTGFFLRLNLGLGGGSLRGERDPTGGGAVTFSGFGLSGSIAVGGALAPNLILHGDLFFTSILDASADGGVYDRVPDFGYDGDVSMLAPGIGLTYYIMPVNVYLSGALGLANAVWERSDGERQASGIGVAANLVLGKEWWVDPQWGLGLAGQLLLMRAGDHHYDSVRALAFAVLFSATYN